MTVAGDRSLQEQLHPLEREGPTGDLLYHYTKASTLAKILDSGCIHLGPYSRTNDPREQQEWHPLFTMPTGRGRPPERYLRRSEEEEKEAFQATDHYLRRGARLACFSTDRPPSANAEPGTSFHRGWARARMWEQYGDHHVGACLVFDRQELIELVDSHIPHGNGDLFTFGQVSYQDRALTIPIPWTRVVDEGIACVLGNEQLRKGMVNHLYMLKNRDWESEQEFRIVYVRWNIPHQEVDTPIPIPFQDSLKWIVLGEHFPDHERSVITYRKGVPSSLGILRCEWHSGVPLLADAG